MIDKAIEESYAIGYKDGKADYAAGLSPKATRGYVYTYRNGYSDGYHAASGGEKKW